MPYEVPKYKYTIHDRFVHDAYGSKIHVGAQVAFNKSGEVKKGTVIDLRIIDVKPLNDKMDKIYVSIKVEELETEEISDIRNIGAVVFITPL